MTFSIELPHGEPWSIDDPHRKLALRAGLPGARVYDIAADALSKAKALGLPIHERIALALPSSWMVNSPASSQVMRRWALSPGREAWATLVVALEAGPSEWLEGSGRGTVLEVLPTLGEEPFVVEAASKLLALLVPEMVPLMPAPAIAFVLGDAARPSARTFCAMLDWFCAATSAGRDELSLIARAHTETAITPEQALDRLLWFDSEGHRHFEKQRQEKAPP